MSILDSFLDPDSDSDLPDTSGKTKKPLHELAKSRYLNYAMSVITSRALPDVRDGLKPVQRRILYAMYEDLRLTYDKRHRKSAAVVGSVIAKFHPHGDSACYEAMVRMAQSWVMRLPLVDGHGNFGNIDGDNAAAYRYCVTGDTRILTDKGTLKIEDVSEEEEDIELKVIGVEGAEVFADKFFDCGEHPIYELTTREGFSLRGTANHPVLVLEKNAQGCPTYTWKLLPEVKKEDYVVIHRNPFQFENQDFYHNPDLGFLAGALVSEGWYSEKRAGFNNTDKQFFDEVKRVWEKELGGVFYTSKRKLPSGKDIYEIDCHNTKSLKNSKLACTEGLTSYDKNIPEFVWRSSKETKRNFLRALFEGDGSIVALPRNSLHLTYSTRSSKLASEVQILLLEFGIVMSQSQQDNDDEIKLITSDRRTIRTFMNEVGFWSKKQSYLEDIFSSFGLNPGGISSDRIPFLSDYIRNKEASSWLERNNFDCYERLELNWDKIQSETKNCNQLFEEILNRNHYFATVESVELAGHESVYSLRVQSEDHAYIGNGFINHNTEAKLREVVSDLMKDIRSETVEFIPNFDSTTSEPVVLPATLPLLLINGVTGIAVGMATNIPPHNPGEVVDAAIDLLRNPSRKSSTLVRNHLNGPDFPTGGVVVESPEEMEEIYTEGRGSITIRSKWHTEKKRRKKYLVITEIPYAVSKQSLVEKIAQHIIDNELPQVEDIRDESTDDIRIVMELKKGANLDAVMAYLFKYTPLESKFHYNLTCLIPDPDNPERVIPEELELNEILQHFLDFRMDVVRKRLEYELKGLQARIHILEGFVTVLSDAQAAVDLVMEATSKSDARQKIMDHYGIDEDQAEHVLNTKIYRLAGYEIQGVKEELEDKLERASEIQDLLEDEEARKDLIISEMKDLKKKYGTDRVTTLEEDVKSFDYDESMYIEEVDVHCVVSRAGWVRRQKSYTDLSTLRVRDADELGWVIQGNTREVILFFTNVGKVYTARIDDLPDTTGYGDPVQSMFSFSDGEKVIAVFVQNKLDLEGTEEMVAVAAGGNAVRFDASKYLDPSTAAGRSYMRLDDGDEVVNVEAITQDDDHVVIVSRDGRVLSFKPEEINHVKGVAKGVKTMSLSKKDSVLAFSLTNGTRGGTITVETNRGAEHDVRHTTYRIGKRGQHGSVGIKRGSYVKWKRQTKEIKK